MKSIKMLRSKYGLTQTQLAQKLGMAKTSIVYIENDKTHTLSDNVVEKLCKTFNVSEIELFKGTDNLKHKPKTKQELADYILTLQEELENWQ